MWVRRGYSSVVEHSTADREVPGSNPGVPFLFYCRFLITPAVFFSVIFLCSNSPTAKGPNVHLRYIENDLCDIGW